LITAWSQDPRKIFAEWPQLMQVLSVVIPTAIYVSAIPFVGIYVSSLLLIAAFMMWFGRYGIGLSAAGIGRRGRRRLPDVRKMVPRAVAEGANRRLIPTLKRCAYRLGEHTPSWKKSSICFMASPWCSSRSTSS